MNRHAILTITGYNEDGTVTRQSAVGEYYERNDSLFVLYEDETGDGLKNKNRIKLKGKRLELVRKGSVTTCMIFEPGLKHVTDYSTPYGMTKLCISTESVKALRLGDSVEISAVYDLSDGERVINRCKILVNIEFHV